MAVNDKLIDSVFSNTNKDISWVRDRTIFLTIHGSIAYGLNDENSDVDLRGICTVPKKYLHGYNSHFDQLVRNDPDAQIFSLQKFFKLSSENNPNTLELMWVNPKHHLILDDLGRELIDNRDLFLSKQIKERYIGYAKSQAHRIRSHRKWLLNPFTHKPTREEYGLPERPQIEKNQFDAVKALILKKLAYWEPSFEPFSESQKIYLKGEVADILTEMDITHDAKWLAAARTIGLSENLIEVIKSEKEFENKLTEYDNFQRWKKNRNPKRAAGEAKYGYDLKHATQLVRLLRVGDEALDTGTLNVERIHDREELLEIKHGGMPFDKLIDYTDALEKKVRLTWEKSKLPNQPNIKKLDVLCTSLVDKSLSKFSSYSIKKYFKNLFDEQRKELVEG